LTRDERLYKLNKYPLDRHASLAMTNEILTAKLEIFITKIACKD